MPGQSVPTPDGYNTQQGIRAQKSDPYFAYRTITSYGHYRLIISGQRTCKVYRMPCMGRHENLRSYAVFSSPARKALGKLRAQSATTRGRIYYKRNMHGK